MTTGLRSNFYAILWLHVHYFDFASSGQFCELKQCTLDLRAKMQLLDLVTYYQAQSQPIWLESLCEHVERTCDNGLYLLAEQFWSSLGQMGMALPWTSDRIPMSWWSHMVVRLVACWSKISSSLHFLAYLKSSLQILVAPTFASYSCHLVFKTSYFSVFILFLNFH